MRHSNLLMTPALLLVFLAATGCGQIRESLPTMERVLDVAQESAREPATWAPIAAATVIGFAGVDDNISDWASDETPIFGSQNSADSFSDDLRNALIAGAVISSVIAPTGAAEYSFPTRRFAASVLGINTVAGIVKIGKVTVQRERPDETDDESFPSGHSGASFSSAVLLEQNLNATIQRPWLRRSVKVGTTSAAALVAWARVEAQRHFPVDVLVSAGLSNFVSKVFYRSLVENNSGIPPIGFEASRNGFTIRMDHKF